MPGVYFWGFKFTKGMPETADEFVIYYIGKSTRNVIERMMQEITQLVFGGYGHIFSRKWLKKNNTAPNLTYLKEISVKSAPAVHLYSPSGMADVQKFLNQPSVDLKVTLNWMRKNLIFTWIEIPSKDVAKAEREFHQMVKAHILGVNKIKSFKAPSTSSDKREYFSQLEDRKHPLADWLKRVNENIIEANNNRDHVQLINLEEISGEKPNLLLKAWNEHKFSPGPKQYALGR